MGLGLDDRKAAEFQAADQDGESLPWWQLGVGAPGCPGDVVEELRSESSSP